MQVDFVGYPLSNIQKEMIVSTVGHVLDYLVSTRMKRTLEITITIEKDLFKDTMIWGDMSVEEECRSPKLFDVRLNYSGVQSFGQLIKVLCHELIHVAQFATRRLRHLSGPHRVGFGRLHYTSSDVDYEDRPWELEAHALEDEIYAYVREKNETIENYIQAKACDRWRPESAFLASEL